MLQIGTIFHTNYTEGSYRIIDISRGCDCPGYIDELNNRERAKRTALHCHIVAVPAQIPIGKERENDHLYFSQYVEHPDGRVISVDKYLGKAMCKPKGTLDELHIEGIAVGIQSNLFDLAGNNEAAG